MWNPDSVDKIITTYFASLTRKSFTYRGKTFEPRLLKASPLLYRNFVCNPMCGGCCSVATLDWLPGEPTPYEVPTRLIEFDGKQIPIQSDMQKDTKGKKCKNLNLQNGWCNIHEQHALSCDFECLKFFMAHESQVSTLTHIPFPRKWSYTRVDGGKGGLCEMAPLTPQGFAGVVRRMRRLQDWIDHFGVDSCLPEVIAWVESGPHTEPAVFNTHVKVGPETNLFITE